MEGPSNSSWTVKHEWLALTALFVCFFLFKQSVDRVDGYELIQTLQSTDKPATADETADGRFLSMSKGRNARVQAFKPSLGGMDFAWPPHDIMANGISQNKRRKSNDTSNGT